LLPAPVGLLFGVLLQWRFDLPPRSFLNFTWVAYLAQLIFVLLLIIVLRSSVLSIDTLDTVWHYPIIISIPIILSVLLTISCMGHFGGWSVALHFSLFFAIGVAAFSGVLTTLPEKTVSGLGLGAYQAELITLDPSFCDRDMSALGIMEDCSLRDVHVVWSFGDSLVLRPVLDPPKHVQIPTSFVRSVVRSAPSD
jgi:hypothetical protein